MPPRNQRQENPLRNQKVKQVLTVKTQIPNHVLVVDTCGTTNLEKMYQK